MLVNGWNFYILTPFESNATQPTQSKYIEMYNKAYNSLLNQLCIPDPATLSPEDSTPVDIIYYINFSGENDKIQLDEDYDYTFLKSVFIEKKFKKLRNDVSTYYKFRDMSLLNIEIEEKRLYILLRNNK